MGARRVRCRGTPQPSASPVHRMPHAPPCHRSTAFVARSPCEVPRRARAERAHANAPRSRCEMSTGSTAISRRTFREAPGRGAGSLNEDHAVQRPWRRGRAPTRVALRPHLDIVVSARLARPRRTTAGRGHQHGWRARPTTSRRPPASVRQAGKAVGRDPRLPRPAALMRASLRPPAPFPHAEEAQCVGACHVLSAMPLRCPSLQHQRPASRSRVMATRAPEA